MAEMPDLGRRRFLFGRYAETSPDPEIPRIAAINQACLALNGVACMSCRDVCPSGAMRFELALGGARPRVEADRCTGCGDCLQVCPTGALSLFVLEGAS